MMAADIRHATQADDHLNTLTICVINGWQSIRAKGKEETALSVS